jgi:hypothetical protein
MQIDEKFGQLTVVEKAPIFIDHTGRQRAMWVVVCNCGVKKTVRQDGLKGGRINSCGCSRKTTTKRIDLTGKKFGRLTVVERAGSIKSGTASSAFSIWSCKCDCGENAIVRGVLLRRGHTKSCGCLRSELVSQRAKNRILPMGRAGRNDVLNSYKQSARMRGLAWKLSEQEFDVLIKNDCHYCDSRPLNFKKRPTFNGGFAYSGIDRKDNVLGYTPENVVPCCWTCNKMKGTLTYKQFLTHIRKIQTIH